jgi:signal transduction histidine kinase
VNPSVADHPRLWSRVLSTPGSATAAEQHHGRLLAAVSVVIGSLDLISAVQAGLFAPRSVGSVIAPVLACAAAAALVAFVLNRRGTRGAGLAVLVGTQLLIPTVIGTYDGKHDPASVLELGVWFAPAIIIASAFLSHRFILAVGGVATGLLVASLLIVGGLRAATAFQAVVFVATVTSLIAVAARHRDRLDVIHQTELKARNADLQKLRDTLEERVVERTRALLGAEKMAAIGRLTAGIAHEMSSPLAAVLASVVELQALVDEYDQSISDRTVEPEDHRAVVREMTEALTTARKAADRSATFVRSIKAQTRVSVVGRHEPFDAGALVRDCAQLLGHAARSASCEVVVRADAGIRAEGCPSRLGQAVTNLLQNAIDATGELGGGEVVVDVAAERATNTLVIRVLDHGGGIPDSVLPRVFEPLFTTKPYGRGTGLGLAIVREAVEDDLGGHVEVETTVGQGSTFVLKLPLVCERKHHAA